MVAAKSTHVYPSFNNPTIHNTTPLHLTRQHDDMSQSIQNTIPISRTMAPRLFVASPFLSTMRMGRISRALPSNPWVPPRSLVGGVATIECWRWIGAAGPRSGPESREAGKWIVAAGPRSGHESIEYVDFVIYILYNFISKSAYASAKEVRDAQYDRRVCE